jgi:hypothetical protein
MGSWDSYCAICGGPMSTVEVARKPRTARFKRRRAREIAKRQAENIPDDQPVHIHDPSATETMEEYEARKVAGDVSSDEDAGSEGDEESDSGDSLDSEEERYTYDPEILSERDVDWIQIIRVLGFNHNAPGLHK